MDGMKQRAFWVATMARIAEPVLTALSQRKLKERLPLEFHKDRSRFAPLEAFARLSCGIAPWLELEGLCGEEDALRKRYLGLMHECLDAATDPQSPDYMEFGEGGQPLVDAAFLSHAVLRAPKQIADAMKPRVKGNMVKALKLSRNILPPQSNWLFFSAMVEAALHVLGEPHDKMRVDYAVNSFMDWYKGDGIYGDGRALHMDYYNSFVIQPMFVDVVRLFESYAGIRTVVMDRAQRYAAVLERMIAPDGSYPIVGRSVVYRFGAFQHLSQAALQHFLAPGIRPAQVRCALSAVIGRVMQADNFDGEGWLVPGVYGYQPSLAEGYINTGSLYLCTCVFLALGLAPQDEFWAGQNEKWTSQRIYTGEDLDADHAIGN